MRRGRILIVVALILILCVVAAYFVTRGVDPATPTEGDAAGARCRLHRDRRPRHPARRGDRPGCGCVGSVPGRLGCGDDADRSGPGRRFSGPDGYRQGPPDYREHVDQDARRCSGLRVRGVDCHSARPDRHRRPHQPPVVGGLRPAGGGQCRRAGNLPDHRSGPGFSNPPSQRDADHAWNAGGEPDGLRLQRFEAG